MIYIYVYLLMMFNYMYTYRMSRVFSRLVSAVRWAFQKLKNLQDQGVVYFTKRASMSQINRALQYIEQNEEARWVKARFRIFCVIEI